MTMQEIAPKGLYQSVKMTYILNIHEIDLEHNLDISICFSVHREPRQLPQPGVLARQLPVQPGHRQLPQPGVPRQQVQPVQHHPGVPRQQEQPVQYPPGVPRPMVHPVASRQRSQHEQTLPQSMHNIENRVSSDNPCKHVNTLVWYPMGSFAN